MKSFDRNIQKYTSKTRLKASERHELRERILAYMEYHPLPKQSAREEVEKIESEQFKTIHFNTIYTRIVAGVFAVLLVVGVPVAAERAVPGDVLYPFKTQINEGIRSKFADSPYEKVVLETELLERRIAEARLLESEGKLTKEVEAKISEIVQEHANAAQQSIAALQNSNSEDAAIAQITFDSALEVQSAVLNARLDSHEPAASSSIAEVVKRVRENSAARKSTSTPTFEGLMARVEIETTRAYELFESINKSTTEEQRTDIERRLEDIGRKLEKAQKLHTNNDSKAINELVSAFVLTQKLIMYMTNIDVNTTITLEELIPVELTDEERTLIAQELLANIRDIEATVQSRSEHGEDTELLEKVSLGLEELSTYIGTATSSLEAEDIDGAEAAIVQAYELATDLREMTNSIEVPDEEEEGSDKETKSNEESASSTSTTAATSTATTTESAE